MYVLFIRDGIEIVMGSVSLILIHDFLTRQNNGPSFSAAWRFKVFIAQVKLVGITIQGKLGDL